MDSEADAEREVTGLLIRYRSPIAAVSFPRYVNKETKFQAASPAFETTRLLHCSVWDWRWCGFWWGSGVCSGVEHFCGTL